jgi:hypothetical protein
LYNVHIHLDVTGRNSSGALDPSATGFSQVDHDLANDKAGGGKQPAIVIVRVESTGQLMALIPSGNIDDRLHDKGYVEKPVYIVEKNGR